MCLFFHKWKTVATMSASAEVESILFQSSWQETILFEFEKCSKCDDRRVISNSRNDVFKTAEGREIQIMWEKCNVLPSETFSME